MLSSGIFNWRLLYQHTAQYICIEGETLQQALNAALSLPAEDKGRDMSLVVLDGDTWRKLLISYDQLALTKSSLVPIFATVIISTPTQFSVTNCATCMGTGGMEGTAPTSFGTDLKHHCNGSVKTGSLFIVCGIGISHQRARAFTMLKNVIGRCNKKKSIGFNFALELFLLAKCCPYTILFY